MKVSQLFIFLLITVSAPSVSLSETLPSDLENAYERGKNGPPLTNVIHKVSPAWLFSWLSDPQRHTPSARMPKLELAPDEVKAVISFLTSIADKEPLKISWSPYLHKHEEDMSDEEYEKLAVLLDKGRVIWRRARCTICHTVAGPVGGLIGGYVDLRVAIDLSGISAKINRNWAYRWLKDSKEYFPDTAMPRYRFTDAEIRALVEFILRDEAFARQEEMDKDEEVLLTISDDPADIEKGRRLVELSRCVLCHDIDGVKNLVAPRPPERPEGAFPKLLSDVRCLSCHRIRGRGGDYGPDLTYAGSKLKAEWIENFLHSPDVIRPMSQQMPEFKMSAEEARIAARYIKTHLTHSELAAGTFGAAEISETRMAEGRDLYHHKGCRACHQIEDQGGIIGPDLTYAGDRLETAYIYFHLKNPHRINPYTAEPNYNLSDAQAEALTLFLAGQVTQRSGAGR